MLTVFSLFPDDHSILTAEVFRGFVPKELHVSTITKEVVKSCPSEVVRLPANLIKEITIGAVEGFGDMKKVRVSVKIVEIFFH